MRDDVDRIELSFSALYRPRHLPRCRLIIRQQDCFNVRSDPGEQGVKIVNISVNEGDFTLRCGGSHEL